MFVVGTALAADALAGDCFNDEPPARTDLEPPIPGRDADLLRITDVDVARLRAAMRAHEQAGEELCSSPACERQQGAVAGDAPPQARR